VLEYPNDPVTWGNATKYEYLLGKDMLVAPVFKSEAKRDSIYLPEGKWVDFWDGTEYQGKTTLMNYSAPLDKLPLFIRAGAILPMYQQMMYDWEHPTDTLTLNIYPFGKSSFTMYEDDGLTREHRKGVYATTKFEVSASEIGNTPIRITINAAKGEFEGRLKKRSYLIDLHLHEIPSVITVNEKKLKRIKSREKLIGASSGWFFDPTSQNGILHLKTETFSTDITSVIDVKMKGK
jgi:alpha-glucosidase (family GH31 glycosyl hydrolase)